MYMYAIIHVHVHVCISPFYNKIKIIAIFSGIFNSMYNQSSVL